MDISSLRERRDRSVLTVSELNLYVKNLLNNAPLLANVCVKGEISNFVSHRSGHLYFSLKDEEGQVAATMFRSYAAGLKFMPENGMKVLITGKVDLFTRDGKYQIYAYSMQPDGLGALYLAYEQLKKRLEEEGLFNEAHKKPLPRYPKAVGVITSPTGAAVRDILNIIARRYPPATVYLYPALVQGDGAAADLVAGVDYLDKSGLCDVIIIGRGGGSIEDLWAFNDEALARRIYDCRIPVVSAVGHETDFTICDFVADLRAPTPSAAAELTVPDMRELLLRIDDAGERLDRALIRAVEQRRTRLSDLTAGVFVRFARDVLPARREKAGNLGERATRAIGVTLSGRRASLAVLVGKAEAMSPLRVLGRGYAIAQTEQGTPLRAARDFSVGESFKLRYSDGDVTAYTRSIRTDTGAREKMKGTKVPSASRKAEGAEHAETKTEL